MLHRFSEFTKNRSHLLHLFKAQVSGCLEYCSTVWHIGLTDADSKDIERIQRAAMRVVMGNKYEGYEEALKLMKLDSLKRRRERRALKFVQKSLKQQRFSISFPCTPLSMVWKKGVQRNMLLTTQILRDTGGLLCPIYRGSKIRILLNKKKILNACYK